MEVRFLEGHLSLEGSSRKALRPGGEDLEIPFPHSTRSPQLGSEWSWLGNPAKTFRNPSEGLVVLNVWPLTPFLLTFSVQKNVS